MPTKSRRENKLIARFLSAYENYSWADAEISWLDEQIDGTVEALAVRKVDRVKLAIEHTIIEPFVGEKEDFAFFERAFLAIEGDTSLRTPGRWIRVFVPVGILRGQHKQSGRDAIVSSVHEWLRTHCATLQPGLIAHSDCWVTISGKRIPIPLRTKVVPLRGPGLLWVRRQQLENNLDKVVERALQKKLPKLVRTDADKRILLLERQHSILRPETVISEVEKQRSGFPELNLVEEIWIVETMSYEPDELFGFERFQNGELLGQMFFQGSQLLDKLENGESVVVSVAV